MFQTKLCRKTKHILRSIFVFTENRAVCEKMWKSIGERGWPQMAV